MCYTKRVGRKPHPISVLGDIMESIAKASRVYKLMIERCYNEKMTGYKNYGGRGIYVSDEWLNNPTDFFNWYKEGYFEDCQVDRIDNSGPYSRENCQLVTAKQNSRNRRTTRRHKAFGESKNLAEWAEDERCHEKNWRNLAKRIQCGSTLEQAMSKDYKKIKSAKSSATQRAAGPKIEAFGESKSLADWADDERCQAAKNTLWDRINRGWDAETAITTPGRVLRNYGTLEAFGETKSVSEWANDERCLCAYSTLTKRLAAGHSLESAMTMAPTRGRKPNML